jgi:4-amino-4-deoxy-L-arabinose transferase-like glycosyltransferase
MFSIRHSRFILFLGVVLLVLLAAAPVLTYPMGRDQGMYANIGRSILKGGIPYIDMWDIKPPPIYYIYAVGIGIFGTTTASIRAIDFTLIPFGMLGLFLFGERLKNRQLGLLAALVYGIFYFNEDFQNLTQSDSLVTVLLIWAAYSAYRSMLSEDSRFSWRWAFVAGALCGVILWFKHYYAFFVLALVINRLLIQKADITPLSTSAAQWRGLGERSSVLPYRNGLVRSGAILWHSHSVDCLQAVRCCCTSGHRA